MLFSRWFAGMNSSFGIHLIWCAYLLLFMLDCYAIEQRLRSDTGDQERNVACYLYSIGLTSVLYHRRTALKLIYRKRGFAKPRFHALFTVNHLLLRYCQGTTHPTYKNRPLYSERLVDCTRTRSPNLKA